MSDKKLIIVLRNTTICFKFKAARFSLHCVNMTLLSELIKPTQQISVLLKKKRGGFVNLFKDVCYMTNIFF